MTTLTAEKITDFYHRSDYSLDEGKIRPVYWDVRFDNFIVNKSFELQTIIDLENVELTALDYPLFVIHKQMDEPEIFLREEVEKFAERNDYANLKTYYKKYCPQMFEFSNQVMRLKIYPMLDVLHLLKEWSHVNEL